MRDEIERHVRLGLGAAITIVMSAMASPHAGAQTVRGYGQVQYQKLDPAGTSGDREIWLNTIQIDATRRFQSKYDVSAQLQLRDLSYAGRPEGTRAPRGFLRVAHPRFGASVAYRPVRITNEFGVTADEHELQLTGHFARERWPSLNGTYTRRTRDTATRELPTVGTTRSVSAAHELGRMSLHAAYSDQLREGADIRTRTEKRRNMTGGSSVRITPPRSSFTAHYDATETRQFVDGTGADRTLVHSMGLNGGTRFSPRTDASLTYGFRRTLLRGRTRSEIDDHDGNAVTRYAVTRAIGLTGGGGVRSVRTFTQRDVQWYLLLLASADGKVRPGWTAGAGVARSWNWYPRDRARPIDTYQASSRMRLAQGLDLDVSGQVNVTEPSGAAQADTAGRSARVVSRLTARVTATPVRGFTGAYSVQGYRSGAGLTGDAAASRSDGWDLRWTANRKLQLTGSLQRFRGLLPSEPTLRVRQATAQWNPSQHVELSSSYLRSDSVRRDPSTELPAGRETLSSRLLVGLSRSIKSIVVWNVVDPGKDIQATQLEVTLTLSFRR